MGPESLPIARSQKLLRVQLPLIHTYSQGAGGVPYVRGSSLENLLRLSSIEELLKRQVSVKAPQRSSLLIV